MKFITKFIILFVACIHVLGCTNKTNPLDPKLRSYKPKKIIQYQSESNKSLQKVEELIESGQYDNAAEILSQLSNRGVDVKILQYLDDKIKKGYLLSLLFNELNTEESSNDEKN